MRRASCVRLIRARQSLGGLPAFQVDGDALGGRAIGNAVPGQVRVHLRGLRGLEP
jgi:hypothetical protein